MKFRGLLSGLLLALGFNLSLFSTVYAGFDEGMIAYKHLDYKTALHEWLPLAEQNNARAQSNIGLMYANGRGVALNYSVAAIWLRKSAEQGNPDAQFLLGAMYETNMGVPKDLVLAHMLYSLAASMGDEKALSLRLHLGDQLSATQLREAQLLASNWEINTPLPTKTRTGVAVNLSAKNDSQQNTETLSSVAR